MEPAGEMVIRVQAPAAAANSQKDLSVLSANLWHDWPWHRRSLSRLEAFVDLVEGNGVDILLLQEVMRSEGIQVDGWLADRLGMSYVYSRANGHHSAIGFEEGLAIYSRFPLSAPRVHHLGSHTPFDRRIALTAEVGTPYGGLQVFSAHLSPLGGSNARQLRRLQTWVEGVAGGRTALIGGDFNASERREHVEDLRRRWMDTYRMMNPHGEGKTFEIKCPSGRTLMSRRLDYLFLLDVEQRLAVTEAEHLFPSPMAHSDHRAVFTRFQVR